MNNLKGRQQDALHTAQQLQDEVLLVYIKRLDRIIDDLRSGWVSCLSWVSTISLSEKELRKLIDDICFGPVTWEELPLLKRATIDQFIDSQRERCGRGITEHFLSPAVMVVEDARNAAVNKLSPEAQQRLNTTTPKLIWTVLCDSLKWLRFCGQRQSA